MAILFDERTCRPLACKARKQATDRRCSAARCCGEIPFLRPVEGATPVSTDLQPRRDPEAGKLLLYSQLSQALKHFQVPVSQREEEAEKLLSKSIELKKAAHKLPAEIDEFLRSLDTGDQQRDSTDPKPS
jgi:hypothetical protein